ncbi:MAG: hypothetical protein HC899_17060 [Leptolyngbyaceae cyanobacterium SM1_4_3]|nr:hypothetical protein [Leptolyngbyaceae cyanobacterium SM1_4_3]
MSDQNSGSASPKPSAKPSAKANFRTTLERHVRTLPLLPTTRTDWSEATDVSIFYGRA